MAAGRRILLAYLVYFGSIGAAFPYLPVFYRDFGLELAQIGTLTAIQAAVQLLLAPVWGGLADRFPHTRLTLPLAAVVATIGATILFLATDIEMVFAGSLILYGGLSGIGPTLDARTLETLGPERRGRFGEVRAFGSLAFVVSTVAVGFLLDAEGARSLFWAYLPFLVATALVTATIPRRGTATRSASILRGAGEFLATKGIALFLVGFTVVWASLAAVIGLLLHPGRRARREPRPGRHRVGGRGRHRGAVHVRVPADRRAVRDGATGGRRLARVRRCGPCWRRSRSIRWRSCSSRRSRGSGSPASSSAG